RQDSALQFEIVETVAIMRRVRQPYDRLVRQRFFVPKTEPIVSSLFPIGQSGLLAVADIKQIAEGFDGVALLALSQERRDRNTQELTEQVEQRSFDGGDRVDGGAQIKSLETAASGVAVGKCAPDGVQDVLIGPDTAAGYQRDRIFERVLDLLAARHFACSSMS